MLAKHTLAALTIGLTILGTYGGGSPARAAAIDIYVISGFGTWTTSTETTPVSAPGDSFSYSFEIPSPFTGTSITGGLRTPEATNLVYDLNGSPVTVGINMVDFFNSSAGGLFDIYFTDGNLLSGFGPDVGSTGTIQTGTFTASYAINGGPAGTSGQVLVAPIPEPGTATLLAAGILGLGLIRRARGRSAPGKCVNSSLRHLGSLGGR